MAKLVLFDEIHLTFRVPASLPPAQTQSIRRLLRFPIVPCATSPQRVRVASPLPINAAVAVDDFTLSNPADWTRAEPVRAAATRTGVAAWEPGKN